MESHAGPRPAGRPPKFLVPPLSCDCHAHILGPLSRFPYAAERSYTPPEALTGDYLRMIGSLGVERAVIVQPSVYGLDNACTVAAVQVIGKHRSRGVAMIDQTATAADVAALDGAGISAARFVISKKGGPAIEALEDVARKVEPFGWHVELFAPAALWPELLPLVAELPVKLVFDHMGAWPADASASNPTLGKMLDLLQSGRFWTKLTGYRNSVAGYPYADALPLAKLFIRHAPERCVWGSDWPHTLLEGTMPADVELLEMLGEWAGNSSTRRKILVDNPAALYRF